MKLTPSEMLKIATYSALLAGHGILITLAIQQDDYFLAIITMLLMAIVAILILMELVVESVVIKRWVYFFYFIGLLLIAFFGPPLSDLQKVAVSKTNLGKVYIHD